MATSTRRKLDDVTRAIRRVRANSRLWRIDPERVGVMGSSAGGHLASTLLTHFDNGLPGGRDHVDQEPSQPDLGILCYPVITLGEFTHQGLRDGPLGPNPAPELVTELSSELQVTSNTPPTFLWHTWEDTAVPVENSLAFADALRKHGVPFDLHIYQKGGHGQGLGTRNTDFSTLHPWAANCLYWLQSQGFIETMNTPPSPAADPGPFANPILEQRADPWVWRHTDGFY